MKCDTVFYPELKVWWFLIFFTAMQFIKRFSEHENNCDSYNEQKMVQKTSIVKQIWTIISHFLSLISRVPLFEAVHRAS